MLPNYQARSPFVLKHTTSWRASKASETVLGVDNAKSGICYIYLLGTEQSLITVAT